MNSEIKKQISLEKRYNFPETTLTKQNGVYVAVATQTANWLVFDNEEQVAFWELLKSRTISEALEEFPYNRSEAIEVITQIEAKEFDCHKTRVQEKEKTLHLHLSNRCNLACPHCYMDSGSPLEDELSTVEVTKLLNGFVKWGGKKLILTGGEVYLRKDLIDIVSLAYELGLKTQLLTNGTLWSEESIRAISRLISHVQVSIDGYNEEENAKIRGDGNFARALTTVEKFIQNGVFTEIAITPAADGTLYSKIDKYVEFVQGLYTRFGNSNLFSLKISGDMMDGRDLKFSLETKVRHAADVEEIYRRAFGENSLDAPFIEFHQTQGIEDNCIYGNLNITANGEVYACPIISGMTPFAHVRQDSIEKIMELSERAKKISHIDEVVPCNTCELKYICGGDCRVIHYTELARGESICQGCSKAPQRSCSEKHKASIYELMIRTNKQIYH